MTHPLSRDPNGTPDPIGLEELIALIGIAAVIVLLLIWALGMHWRWAGAMLAANVTFFGLVYLAHRLRGKPSELLPWPVVAACGAAAGVVWVVTMGSSSALTGGLWGAGVAPAVIWLLGGGPHHGSGSAAA